MSNVFQDFNLSSLNPTMIQNVMKMYNYVMNHMDSIKTIIASDPDFKSQEAIDLINEFGAIKYPELSYLDRQKAVKQDLESIVLELKKNIQL